MFLFNNSGKEDQCYLPMPEQWRIDMQKHKSTGTVEKCSSEK